MSRGGNDHIETAISYVVILLLILIGGSIFYYQSQFDSRQFGFEPVVAGRTGPLDFNIKEFLPSDFKELGSVETYQADNLYEKINGKAPLYLDAGFVRLDFQAFVMDTDAESFVQVYVYDMDKPMNAFSVYSNQRRAGVKSLDNLSQGYKTEKALFFVAGKYYIEMIGAKIDDTLNGKMLTTALNIDRKFAGEKAVLPSDMFPVENMVPDSVTLYKTDGFGYSGFKDVYVADYEVDGELVTTFIIEKQDAESAKKLFDDYSEYLVANGFSDIGGGVFKYDGIFEIVFVVDKYICGIHEAFDINAAKKVADRLRVNLERN